MVSIRKRVMPPNVHGHGRNFTVANCQTATSHDNKSKELSLFVSIEQEQSLFLVYLLKDCVEGPHDLLKGPDYTRKGTRDLWEGPHDLFRGHFCHNDRTFFQA